MPCDAAAVAALVERLAHTRESAVVVVAAAWEPLCTNDAVLDAQLSQVTPASAAQWWLVELQLGMVDARRWSEACPGGTQVLSMATKLDADRRRAHVWTHCGLERFGAFTWGEWTSADGLLVAPVLAAHTLAVAGVEPALARVVVRALAGL